MCLIIDIIFIKAYKPINKWFLISPVVPTHIQTPLTFYSVVINKYHTSLCEYSSDTLYVSHFFFCLFLWSESTFVWSQCPASHTDRSMWVCSVCFPLWNHKLLQGSLKLFQPFIDTVSTRAALHTVPEGSTHNPYILMLRMTQGKTSEV